MNHYDEMMLAKVEEVYLNKAIDYNQSPSEIDRMEAEYIRDVFLPMLRVHMKYIGRVRTVDTSQQAQDLLTGLYNKFVMYLSLNIAMMVPMKKFFPTSGMLLKQVESALVVIHNDMASKGVTDRDHVD